MYCQHERRIPKCQRCVKSGGYKNRTVRWVLLITTINCTIGTVVGFSYHNNPITANPIKIRQQQQQQQQQGLLSQLSLPSKSRTVVSLHVIMNDQSRNIIDKNERTLKDDDIDKTIMPAISSKSLNYKPIDFATNIINATNALEKGESIGFNSSVAYSTNYSNGSSTIRLQYAIYDMICAGIIGIVTGIVVAYFKLSIESVRVYTYSLNILDYLHNEIGAILIPIIGGIGVGILISSGPFSPGLRGKVSQVEDISNQMNSSSNNITVINTYDLIRNRIQQVGPLFRKTTAAICTLGTGCSLGPEGPCVELGMGISRSCMDLYNNRPPLIQLPDNDQGKGMEVMNRSTWNRILLSCGAAAGVSAGFDAPVSGVFFVLEVMQAAFNDVSIERRRKRQQTADDEDGSSSVTTNLPGGLFSSSSTLSPVLLSSVLAALCSRSILGDHLTFNVANTDALAASPLIELPMFLLLGSICGVVAFLFSQSAKYSRSFFQGEVGYEAIRTMMQSLSPNQRPIIGGLFCGVTALYFPQILFFGYETLNSLLSNTVSVPTNVLLSLLVVKAITTAVCIGSGLVGGTLAPALFLGGVTGASFHNIISDLYQFVAAHTDGINSIPQITFVLADLPDYAMVGSASVLAALFRAPLTASLLLFELSRDYDVILPIIASAGVGSVVADILEDTFVMNEKVPTIADATTLEAHQVSRKVRRDQDSASWGDLADKDDHRISVDVHEQQQ